MGMKSVLIGLVMLSGCAGGPPYPPPAKHTPDCVNDAFNYNFYSNEDQARLTYCYAVLQTIAKEKSEEENYGRRNQR